MVNPIMNTIQEDKLPKISKGRAQKTRVPTERLDPRVPHLVFLL